MASAELRAAIERLALIDRASCSPGEHEAADWIASQLRAQGAAARVERERVHGSYWWPLGATSLLGAMAALAGRRGHRMLGGLLGAAGCAGVIDELGAGRRVLRALLPKQETANVVAEAGDPNAQRTLLVVSHHDAAHTGVFFNPAIAEYLGRLLEDRAHARAQRTAVEHAGLPPSQLPGAWVEQIDLPDVLAPMLPVAAAPALAGLGALLGWRRLTRISGLICGGIIGSFAHIAASSVVPGANDNLTGVATVLALAGALRERPVEGLRVLLVSTGSEESLMEGMRAFAARWFPGLDPSRTHVLCVDSVGSPHLVVACAEGMLQVRDYDPDFEALIAACAAELEIPLRRGFRMRLGTDGYLALRHGLPAGLLMSMNDLGVASNYHWPTDTPDRVDYGTLDDAVRLCEAVVHRLAAGETALGAAPRPGAAPSTDGSGPATKIAPASTQ